MKINLYVVGKIKEKSLTLLIDEYLKRLQGYATTNIIEVADEKIPTNSSFAQEEIVKEKECQRILDKLNPNDYVIILDLNGMSYDSLEWAAFMNQAFIKGQSTLNLVIGGSLGLSTAMKKRANASVSFSRLTFPHQLMRVFVLEQLYRGFRINHHEPYHK